MTETQYFIIDILKIIPDETMCFIQAPSLDNTEFLALMQPSVYDYFIQVQLSQFNKSKLTSIIAQENIEIYFQSIEIRNNSKLLFEAVDGMEIGTISQYVQMPDWFIEKYIATGICLVSEDW